MHALPVTIGAVATDIAPSWIVVLLGFVLAMHAWTVFRRVRGTTLSAAAAWAMAAALAIAIAELGLLLSEAPASPLSASLWGYAAAVGVVCPVIAILGAKRPQDRGWQWVVLSLWLILLAPAGQVLVAPAGERLELFTAWRLLLAIFVMMTLLNYLPTRHYLAALLFACGQLSLLTPYLFDLKAPENQTTWSIAGLLSMNCAGAAAELARSIWRRRHHYASGQACLTDFTRRWTEFRDAFGAFWALRVMQRVNQTAELSHWSVRLHWWTGFEVHARPEGVAATETAIDEKTVVHIQQTLDSLLRRFERVDEPTNYMVATL